MRASSLSATLAAASFALLGIVLLAATPAFAQKKGGTLRLYHTDNPPSTSLLEESTISSVTPFMAVFNNLVMFDPASKATLLPCVATPARLPRKSGAIAKYFLEMYGITFLYSSEEVTPACSNNTGSPLPSNR